MEKTTDYELLVRQNKHNFCIKIVKSVEIATLVSNKKQAEYISNCLYKYVNKPSEAFDPWIIVERNGLLTARKRQGFEQESLGYIDGMEYAKLKNQATIRYSLESELCKHFYFST